MTKVNDLRDEADSQYYFGELKLWYESQRAKTVGVIVEAKSDETLFKKLLHDDCSFFPVDGWVKSIDVLALCEKHKLVGILAIIDADFKRIGDFPMPSRHLFLTDYHDKEMMLCHSEAWASVLSYYADKEKVQKYEQAAKKPVLDFLLEVVKPIGTLRLLNTRQHLDLKFKVLSNNKYKFIDYQDFIDDKTLAIDLNKLLTTVENKSSKQGLFKNTPELKAALQELSQQDYNLKELCNGHDLVNILSIALMHLLGNRKSSTKVVSEELEKDLIIAYRLDDFIKTQLFASLSLWQQENPPFLVQRI